jgi:Zn-dependent protease/CBS domain-containing protein
MSSRGARTLFRVRGVPIRIDFTWIFAVAFFTVLFTGRFHQLARAADVANRNMVLPPFAWGLLLTLALFGSVLLHELAHVFVARRGGVQVQSITLMMLGGLSEIGEVERPLLERRMAAAGPLLSLFLAALFYGLFRGLFQLSPHGPPDLAFGLFYLSQLNLVIGLFNLLPAFPMDGGRIFRSLLVGRFGPLRATRIAAAVGKTVAVGLVLLGIFGGGLWLSLIGIFVFLGGDAESRAMQARTALRGLKVGDFFSRNVATVGPDVTAADAASAMLAARTDVCFVVTDGQPTGAITAATLLRLPVRQRPSVPALSVTQKVPTISPQDELLNVLKLLEAESLSAVAVVDEGRLVGAVSRDDLVRGLQLRELTTR